MIPNLMKAEQQVTPHDTMLSLDSSGEAVTSGHYLMCIILHAALAEIVCASYIP